MRLQPVNLFGTKKQSGIGNIWFSVPEFITLSDTTASAGFTINGENLPLNGTVQVTCSDNLEVTDFLAGYPPTWSSSLTIPYSGYNLATAPVVGNKCYQVRLKPNQPYNNYNETLTCTVGDVTATLNCTGTTNFNLSNLAIYLDASNTDSYSGTTWNNLMAYNPRLTNVGGATFSSGSFLFSGSNNFQGNYIDSFNDYSFMIWFKCTSTNANQTLLSFGKTTIPYAFIEISLNGSYNSSVFAYFPANYSLIPETTPNGDYNDGNWHSYVITRSVSNSPYTQHYVDGVLITTTVRSGTQTDTLGGMPSTLGLGAFYIGYISLVKLFKRVLTSTEILYEHNIYINRYL
jgi:hypothetical protein